MNNIFDEKVFIIAEIGNNHEGSFDNAIKLIDQAKIANVDAVKFQTFKTENFISTNEKERFSKLKQFELSYEEFEKLSKYSKSKNLKFISTPFDIESAIFLKKIVDLMKISSGDNNYFNLIESCLHPNIPLLISSGLSSFENIIQVQEFLKQKKFNFNNLCLLHCVSDYPTSPETANINSIVYLIKNTDFKIGYSDHTIGKLACLTAVAVGARVVEKHFTLDNNFSDFRDHQLSSNPKEMKELVSEIRNVERLLGREYKFISENERKNLITMRRSPYLKNNKRKGETIIEDDVKIIRPYAGIDPNDTKTLIGKVAKKDLQSETPLDFNDFK